jgi:hypothetical protein
VAPTKAVSEPRRATSVSKAGASPALAPPLNWKNANMAARMTAKTITIVTNLLIEELPVEFGLSMFYKTDSNL